jgi:TonB family protein
MTGGLSWLLQASQSVRAFPVQGLTLLFEATLKGTFFLLLAVASTLAMRRASAATRHFVWTLALGALLVLPVASLTVPAWKVPMISLSPANIAGEETVGEFLEVAPPNHQVYADYATRRAGSATIETADYPAWPVWILAIWAAGSLLVAARIAVGELRVRRVAKCSRLLDTSQVKSIVGNFRSRLRISRVVELRTSSKIAIPFTRGAFRPTILLPAEAHQWSREQLELVLAHELAHVHRYDYLTQMPAQVACALFWFHPLVWLAACAMRKERERACDDMVLSLGHPATDYAEFLLVLSRGLRRVDGAWLTSVAMAQSSQLEVRMKALLDPRLNHRPLAASRALPAAALAAALLLALAAVRAAGKSATGNIYGTIHDPSGAVIPGANVTLINMELKYKIVGHSGEDGAFEFRAIPAGRYRFEITSPGFAYTKGADFELKPSSDLHPDITMDVGELIQEVVVHGHKSAENPPAPPPAPRRIRVGGNVQRAKLTYQPKPDYPASAERQGIEGTVVLRAVIGISGQILSLSPYSGPDPVLIKSATDAVRQWRYQPTLLNGLPVEVATTIEVSFQLDD